MTVFVLPTARPGSRDAAGNLRAHMAERAQPGDALFLESLMDTNLYSMGAYFSDQHPELVDDVIEQSVAIEEQGLRGYADVNGMTLEAVFETLLTGLAVRYYKAVAS
jgi:hypothetical protein